MISDKEIPDLTGSKTHIDVSEFFGGNDLNDMFETLTDEEMQKLTDQLSEDNKSH